MCRTSQRRERGADSGSSCINKRTSSPGDGDSRVDFLVLPSPRRHGAHERCERQDVHARGREPIGFASISERDTPNGRVPGAEARYESRARSRGDGSLVARTNFASVMWSASVGTVDRGGPMKPMEIASSGTTAGSHQVADRPRKCRRARGTLFAVPRQRGSCVGPHQRSARAKSHTRAPLVPADSTLVTMYNGIMPPRDVMPEPIPTELLNCRITASSYTDELLPDDEPSSFATHLPFEVRQGDLVVARVHALLLRVWLAEKNGVSPAELFDSVDQDVPRALLRDLRPGDREYPRGHRGSE